MTLRAFNGRVLRTATTGRRQDKAMADVADGLVAMHDGRSYIHQTRYGAYGQVCIHRESGAV
jgi:hypothetical protein